MRKGGERESEGAMEGGRDEQKDGSRERERSLKSGTNTESESSCSHGCTESGRVVKHLIGQIRLFHK